MKTHRFEYQLLTWLVYAMLLCYHHIGNEPTCYLINSSANYSVSFKFELWEWR